MTFRGFNGEVEFSMGYILGVRGFRLDDMGRLTGWSYRTVWTPGENVAVCGKKKATCGQSTYDPYGSSHMHVDSCWSPNPCNGDIEKCEHGFWAYYEDFDSQGENLANQTYAAIIKGYGKTVLGVKGFRSEKAEILAVTVPSSYRDPVLPSALVGRNYPDIRVFDTKTEMFEAYPTEDQTPKQPIDPRDPEFWKFDLNSKKKIIRRVENVSQHVKA